MNENLKAVRAGVLLVMLTLFFGIGLGVGFGVAEDSFQSYISSGVAANPAVHDAKSEHKIWRYAQRAHFHAAGISAFSLGLILLVMVSSLKRELKTAASILIGLGGFYPLSWFSMFMLSPSMGRSAAHHHVITEIFTYVGVGGLLLGAGILFMNVLLGAFQGD